MFVLLASLLPNLFFCAVGQIVRGTSGHVEVAVATAFVVPAAVGVTVIELVVAPFDHI